MELPSSELEFNCLYRNWNWSGIAFIGIGIGVELPLSELELEWNCLYQNWNWSGIAKTELTPALVLIYRFVVAPSVQYVYVLVMNCVTSFIQLDLSLHVIHVIHYCLRFRGREEIGQLPFLTRRSNRVCVDTDSSLSVSVRKGEGRVACMHLQQYFCTFIGILSLEAGVEVGSNFHEVFTFGISCIFLIEVYNDLPFDVGC